ncbi:MAG: hypothetical protein FJ087_03585 [Deltaproteobacteria bacterium]|nr:hypothetical protein [Deltaproteobacteria bacterium]
MRRCIAALASLAFSVLGACAGAPPAADLPADVASDPAPEAGPDLPDAPGETVEEAADVPPEVSYPLAPPGPGFHRAGTAILDARGRTLNLHGASVSNSAKYTPGLLPWHGSGDFRSLATQGFGVVNYLDPHVKACYDRLRSDDALFQRYVEAWIAVARRVKGDPVVLGFDLYIQDLLSGLARRGWGWAMYADDLGGGFARAGRDAPAGGSRRDGASLRPALRRTAGRDHVPRRGRVARVRGDLAPDRVAVPRFLSPALPGFATATALDTRWTSVQLVQSGRSSVNRNQPQPFDLPPGTRLERAA